MELDLNKFRTLAPINELFDESLLFLAEYTKIVRRTYGESICEIGQELGSAIYLMSGKALLIDDEEKQVLVEAGTERALGPLSSAGIARHRIQVASNNATFATIDQDLLYRLLSWEQLTPDQPAVSEEELADGPNFEESQWMMAMLKTKAFQKLPAANIQMLFELMQEISMPAGAQIIKFGDAGDYFYVIKEGRCRVTLPSPSGDTVLAELGPCSSFGEEALLTEQPRNATVSMITNGKLMRLSQQSFIKLLEQPLLNYIDYDSCQEMIRTGSIPIDVRFRSEFEKKSLKNAINLPIQHLRARMQDLNTSRTYILYCNNGQRSTTAAFLLSQQGFDVHVLDGGLPEP